MTLLQHKVHKRRSTNINQESVPQVVWTWRNPATTAAAKQTARRWRAVIHAAVIVGVATLFLLIGHHYGLSLFLYGLSAVVLISGLCFPPIFNILDQFGRWLAKCVGIGLTWLLLTLFYYLCVFPARLILLVTGKDPMQRRWERHRDTYWSERKRPTPQSYTRQY